MSLKKVFYWISIVRPIFDVLVGTFKGIKMALENVKKDECYKEEYSNFVSDDVCELPDFMNNGVENGKSKQ